MGEHFVSWVIGVIEVIIYGHGPGTERGSQKWEYLDWYETFQMIFEEEKHNILFSKLKC